MGQKIASNRDNRVEWVKFLAIVSVIFQHTISAPELASVKLMTHGAVPAFTLISVYYSTNAGANQKRLLRWIGERSLKLYGLFLMWNLFYLLLRFVSTRFGIQSQFEGLTIDSTLFSGYTNALWFLNFILIVNAGSAAVGLYANQAGHKKRFALAITLFVAGVLLSLSPHFAGLSSKYHFVDVSRKACPAALIGVSIGILFKQGTFATAQHRWHIIVAGIAMVFSCYLLSSNRREIFLPETLVGICAIWLGLTILPPSSVSPLSPNLTLWFYLAHSFFLHLLRKVLLVLHINWETSQYTLQLLGFAAILLSLAGSYYALQSKGVVSMLLLDKQRNPKPANAARSL